MPQNYNMFQNKQSYDMPQKNNQYYNWLANPNLGRSFDFLSKFLQRGMEGGLPNKDQMMQSSAGAINRGFDAQTRGLNEQFADRGTYGSGVSAAAQAVMGGERGNALGNASVGINQMDTDYRQKMLAQLLGLNMFEAGQQDAGVNRRENASQFRIASKKGGGSDYAGYAAGAAAGEAASSFMAWLLTPTPEKAAVAAPIIASDINVKENVKVVGLSEEGFPIIEFNYKGDKERYSGTIAQEVEKLRPEAVVKKDGIRYVDYSKIDVPFKKVA